MTNCYLATAAANEAEARDVIGAAVHAKVDGRLVHVEEGEEGEASTFVFEFEADVLDDVEEMLHDHFTIDEKNLPIEFI